jgi:hypothetical protein
VKHFVLDGDRSVIEVDLLTWSHCGCRSEGRELARAEVGHLLILTAFAGIDLSFGEGEPTFFETRVLDGYDELECREASSWDDALAGHATLAERWSGWAEVARGAAARALAGRWRPPGAAGIEPHSPSPPGCDLARVLT